MQCGVDDALGKFGYGRPAPGFPHFHSAQRGGQETKWKLGGNRVETPIFSLQLEFLRA